MPRCPVCGSVRVVVVINRTRGAFCSECGAQWAQRGSEQHNVRPFLPSARRDRHLPVAGPWLRIELFLDGRGIRLSGEVDMENMDRLERALARLTSRGGDIVVDCAALTFMDSSGFGVLMRAAKALGDRGRLILNSPGDLIARTLKLMGVDHVPNIEIQELSPTPVWQSQQFGPGAAHRFELAWNSYERSRSQFARARRTFDQIRALNRALRAERVIILKSRACAGSETA